MTPGANSWRARINRWLGGGVTALGAAIVLAGATSAQAVPTLQVGVPDGEGGYLPYQDNLTDPTEDDTAVGEDGDMLAVGGAFGPNTISLGGQFGSGDDWSDFGFDEAFDGAGAILFAVVPDGTLGDGTLTINGATPIYTTADFEDGFVMPNPPANHAPVQNGDYLFFDIGDFANNPDAVPNFADPGEGAADGQVKLLTVDASGFDWIHFDVFAIETRELGPDTNSRVVSNLTGNPGSHDVTFKFEDDEEPVIPEPLTAGMGMMGLLALVGACRRRR